MTADTQDITVTSLDKRIINYIDQLPRKGHFAARILNDITAISVHHSASKSGQFGLPDFARWHMDPNGRLKAPAICYHFGIEPDGKIYQVNTLYECAWHTIGMNKQAIGIELNGNFETEEPSAAQMDSLIWLVAYLQQVLKKKLEVRGHKEWPGNATACPGKNLMYKSKQWKV